MSANNKTSKSSLSCNLCGKPITFDNNHISQRTAMNQLYKQHFEGMQRVNQQWSNLFWRPSMGEQQQPQQE
jgi:hypothetical protein